MSSKPEKNKAPKPSKPGLTKVQRDFFEELLAHRRKVLTGDVKGLEMEATRKGTDAAGDLSTLPMHLADLGTDSYEQELSLGLMESESDELREVEEALDRIRDGTFGICENCKGAIPKERLRAIPYARLCLKCKRNEEGA